MRTVLLAAFMAFIEVSAPAQSNSSQANDDNLYSLALKASILQMEKEWGHLGHGAYEDKIEIPTNYRHMIVRKDPVITDDLPTEFENHTIEFADDQELVDRYHKLNKSFAVLKVFPIRNQGNVLRIGVSVYWFSYKKRRLAFGVSDWSDVEFRYDCGQGTLVMSSVKLGGI